MPTTRWKSILVAVGDPNRRQHMAINKAAAIARRCHAKLTLLHTFAFPYPVQAKSVLSSRQVLDLTIAAHSKRLEELARPLRQEGLSVHCAVEWDFPPHEAIVRYVLKHRPDLVVAESHRHGKLSRWLLSNTDWELIRACPAPLWFVKTPSLKAKPSLLAAVDPLHAHAKPARLDDTILELGRYVAQLLDAELSMVHAYEEPVVYASGTLLEPIRVPLAPQRARAYVAQIKRLLAALAKRHRIAASGALLAQGDPSYVLPTLAARQSAQAVIMGAVSRRGAARAFIGNTAEKVLDHLNCDVIVIKPSRFVTAVTRKPAHLVNS